MKNKAPEGLIFFYLLTFVVATNKSTSRSCSRLAWASRFSTAAMYSSLLDMGVPPSLILGVRVCR